MRRLLGLFARNRTAPTGRTTTDRRTSARPRADRDQTRPPRRRNAGGYYRSAAYRPFCPSQIREQHFNQARHGLDPGEVNGFLHRVADELTALRAELARTREENLRIKGALRDWQSRFGPRVVRR